MKQLFYFSKDEENRSGVYRLNFFVHQILIFVFLLILSMAVFSFSAFLFKEKYPFLDENYSTIIYIHGILIGVTFLIWAIRFISTIPYIKARLSFWYIDEDNKLVHIKSSGQNNYSTLAAMKSKLSHLSNNDNIDMSGAIGMASIYRTMNKFKDEEYVKQVAANIDQVYTKQFTIEKFKIIKILNKKIVLKTSYLEKGKVRYKTLTIYRMYNKMDEFLSYLQTNQSNDMLYLK